MNKQHHIPSVDGLRCVARRTHQSPGTSRRRAGTGAGGRFRKGQSLVETTIVLGLFLFLLMGGIDLWQFAMTRYTVAQAARAAAFTAATRGGPDGLALNTPVELRSINPAHGRVAATAHTIISRGMTTRHGRATLTVRCPAGCERNAPVVVEMHYQERYWVPVPPLFTIDLTLQAARPIE